VNLFIAIPITRSLYVRLLVCTVVSLLAGSLIAADGGAEVEVPLRKVVLFTSGVGYFQHAAEVNGRGHGIAF
jgi:hypothetical protein